MASRLFNPRQPTAFLAFNLTLVRKCDLGNLVESKKTFVALVSSLQNWVVLVGLQDSLKGL